METDLDVAKKGRRVIFIGRLLVTQGMTYSGHAQGQSPAPWSRGYEHELYCEYTGFQSHDRPSGIFIEWNIYVITCRIVQKAKTNY